MLFVPPVTAGGKQRHSRRLQPAATHLQLHQRTGLRLPFAQPEKWPTAKALRWSQVWCEENRGGGVWPVHPWSGQGVRVCRGQVEVGGDDLLWEMEEDAEATPGWDLCTAAADQRPYPTWKARPRDLLEAPAAQDRLCVWVCVCVNACLTNGLDGWQSVRGVVEMVM